MAKVSVKQSKKQQMAVETVENEANKNTALDQQVVINGGKEVTVLPVTQFKMITKRRRGQPTKYRPIYCEWIVQYFEDAQTVVAIVDDPGGKGGTQTKLETLRVPTIRGFAAKIGVGKSTLYGWAKEHEEFSDALARACALEYAIVEELGLAGRLAKGVAELYFINHLEYRDSRHMDLTTDGDKLPTPITALQLNVNRDTPAALPE